MKAWEHILTKRGSPTELEKLRRLFPDIDFHDDMGFSHIHLLVVGEVSGDLAETLQTKGYQRQINNPDFLGRTPLHWAATRGDSEGIRILLRFRAEVTVIDESRSTPLMSAASSGCPISLKLLLDGGSNILWKNVYGSDALYNACRHQSRLPSVVLLLQSGAPLNSQNNNGHTALIGAAIRNHDRIGRYLLRRGASIDARGAHGESALFEAIFHNSHQFLRLLLQNSANYLLVNNAGSSILHSAALEGDSETLHILLGAGLKGLDPFLRNKENLTAAEMIQRRSIIPEGFEDQFSRLISLIDRDNSTEDSASTL